MGRQRQSRRSVGAALALAVLCAACGVEREEVRARPDRVEVQSCHVRPRALPGEKLEGSRAESLMAAPDLVVLRLESACGEGGGRVNLTATVANQGSATVPGGLQVAFYQGAGTGRGALLGVVTLEEALAPGATAEVTLQLDSRPEGLSRAWAVADDNGRGQGQVHECNEGNNDKDAEVIPCDGGGGGCGEFGCPDGGSGDDGGGGGGGGGGSDGGGGGGGGGGCGEFGCPPDGGGGGGGGDDGGGGGGGGDDGGGGGCGEGGCGRNQPPVALCRDVVVGADEACLGEAYVDNGSYDVDGPWTPPQIGQSPWGPFSVGTHSVSLRVYDGLVASVCRATVTVVDDTAPAITCPAAVVYECCDGGKAATVEASASDNCSSVQTTCTPGRGHFFRPGTTPVQCSATDRSGNRSTCRTTVTVRDTQAPQVWGDLAPRLTPADHEYRTVRLSQCAEQALDGCLGRMDMDVYGRIVRVVSDEPEDAPGDADGATCADIELVGPSEMRVRAEYGNSRGRVYTVHYVVADAAGNESPGRCTVQVLPDPTWPQNPSAPAYCVGTGCPAGTGGSPSCGDGGGGGPR